MTILKCLFKDSDDVPCGATVPAENDHSKKQKMTFIEFVTHGLCVGHSQRVVASAVDPEVLDLVLIRRRLDRQDAKALGRY